MTEYDLVIIGGGPGGLSAGIYAMRAALKTVLIEKSVFGGQITMTDSVDNYPGFVEINGYELAQKFYEHAQKFSLETIQREVIELNPGKTFHEVKLSNNEILKARAVILACGGSARSLGIPGEKDLYGKGVSYCATCDGFFFRDKVVAVIGGGNTAVEEALYLSKLVKKVYLIHRRDELRASAILQKKVIEETKIDILWNTIPIEIKSDDQRVTGLSVKDKIEGTKSELSLDGVFIFIGYNPNNQIVPEKIKKTNDGYIITDEACRTNINGIYAVGDLRNNYAKQIVISASEGCIAALDAAKYVENQKMSD